MALTLLPFRRRQARVILLTAGIVIGLVLALDWRWSTWPPLYLEESRGGDLPVVAGYMTVDTLIETIEWMLEKPGGYLSNDIFPPSLWLDNMPSFELGVLVQQRDLARILRTEHGSSRARGAGQNALAIAETSLNAPYDSWILPATESRLREARAALVIWRSELVELGERDALFRADQDSLADWLRVVERRLGDLSQRLAASVRRTGDDPEGIGVPASVRDQVPAPADTTRWVEIDNVFFEARGSAWALLQFVAAAEVDFEAILVDRDRRARLERIRRELEGALAPLASPVILNGGGYGLFANHSLVLASYLSRAQAAVIDLRVLLETL